MVVAACYASSGDTVRFRFSDSASLVLAAFHFPGFSAALRWCGSLVAFFSAACFWPRSVTLKVWLVVVFQMGFQPLHRSKFKFCQILQIFADVQLIFEIFGECC